MQYGAYMVEDKYASVGVSMPIDLISAIRDLANKRGVDFSAVVVEAIQSGLDKVARSR